jgi:hypothetical protein
MKIQLANNQVINPCLRDGITAFLFLGTIIFICLIALNY